MSHLVPTVASVSASARRPARWTWRRTSAASIATVDAVPAESISAWDMGPVVSRLWHQEKTAGRVETSAVVLNERHLNTVGYVVSRYGRLSGAELERLTHTEQPWLDADARRRPDTSAPISADAIRAFFVQQAAVADDEDESSALPDSDAISRWLSDIRSPTSANVVQPDDIDRLRARIAAGGGHGTQVDA